MFLIMVSLWGTLFTNIANSHTGKESFCMNLTKEYKCNLTANTSLPWFESFRREELADLSV